MLSSKMYSLCNKYHWFIGGTSEQYDKLFKMVSSGRSAWDLATAIWLCTPGVSQADVYNILCKEGFKDN